MVWVLKRLREKKGKGIGENKKCLLAEAP